MIFINNTYRFKHSCRSYFLVVLLVTQISGCALSPWENTIDKNMAEQKSVQKKKRAMVKRQTMLPSRISLLDTKELQVMKWLTEADQARSKGAYQRANVLYEHVLSVLPEEPNAIDGKNATNNELNAKKKIGKPSLDNTKLRAVKVASKAKSSTVEMPKVAMLKPPKLTLAETVAVNELPQVIEKAPAQKIEPPQLTQVSDKPMVELKEVNTHEVKATQKNEKVSLDKVVDEIPKEKSSVVETPKVVVPEQVKPVAVQPLPVVQPVPVQPVSMVVAQQVNEKVPTKKSEPARLKLPSEKPVTLEFREANIQAVFEALSRETGINFILDNEIKPDTKVTIFIKKMRIEDAIEMVLSSSGLQKKALSENTALVFPSTQQKVKDYQDLMIRSFYFTNTSAKQVSVLLKTMLKTKDIFVDDRLNMLVMRDTPDVIHIAEKLIAANDLEDPEVMLDIEVLEVSRSRLQELGITYPSQLSVLSTADGTLNLAALKNLTSQMVGVTPNPEINFKKTTGDVNLISNPRIRVRNNEKAKILVGDKVPIITTTSTANVGVSDSVQYVDVGLKLDVEPRITLNGYVNIRVGLEVSSLGAKTTSKNGAVAYTIGTRNANTVLRLKSGETQVLAGLILDDERKNASKLPGLGDIPLLGRLFSNQEDKKTKTEIVLTITPRIIRNISPPKGENSEYWSGTESFITDKPLMIAPVISSPVDPQGVFNKNRTVTDGEPSTAPEVTETIAKPPAQQNGMQGQSQVITPSNGL